MRVADQPSCDLKLLTRLWTLCSLWIVAQPFLQPGLVQLFGLRDHALAHKLLLTHVKPILDQDNARIDEGTFDGWTNLQKILVLLVCPEIHDVLDSGPVIPAAVENDDLTRSI